MNLQQTKPLNNPDQLANCQPNPARFAIYNILPGEKGFTIPNCDFVFDFDAYGGWYDEYGNYYNAQGESAEVPIEYEEDLQGDPQIGYYEDEVNRYADNNNERDNEKEDEPLEFYDNKHLNGDNQKVLEMYKNSKEISVELHNLSNHWNEDNFERFLVDNKIEWIIFQFEYDFKAQFSGSCFITLNKENTLKLLALNGYKILGKNLNILVIEPNKAKKIDENPEPVDGKNSSELKKPFEEAKTLENDQDEPTYKRPYPNGKPSSSEKAERNVIENPEKTIEHVGLPRNMDSKESKKGN